MLQSRIFLNVHLSQVRCSDSRFKETLNMLAPLEENSSIVPSTSTTLSAWNVGDVAKSSFNFDSNTHWYVYMYICIYKMFMRNDTINVYSYIYMHILLAREREIYIYILQTDINSNITHCNLTETIIWESKGQLPNLHLQPIRHLGITGYRLAAPGLLSNRSAPRIIGMCICWLMRI